MQRGYQQVLGITKSAESKVLWFRQNILGGSVYPSSPGVRRASCYLSKSRSVRSLVEYFSNSTTLHGKTVTQVRHSLVLALCSVYTLSLKLRSAPFRKRSGCMRRKTGQVEPFPHCCVVDYKLKTDFYERNQ